MIMAFWPSGGPFPHDHQNRAAESPDSRSSAWSAGAHTTTPAQAGCESAWRGDRVRDRSGRLGRGRPSGGHGERDAQPMWVVQAGLGRAVVGRGDSVDDGEPEAGPRQAALTGPVEPVEVTGEVIGRHTGAVVADLDGDAAVAL